MLIKLSGSRGSLKFVVGGIKGCGLLLAGLIKLSGSRNSIRFDEEAVDKGRALIEVSFRSSVSGIGRSMTVMVGAVSV